MKKIFMEFLKLLKNIHFLNFIEIERHRGRIIIVTYEADAPQESLFFVGKGVTYDTGGADIKAGGIMAGMSRDKCGAAAVGGFLKVNTSLDDIDFANDPLTRVLKL